ncbi:Fis family transcriptional regulator [Acuticoccus sediminis]|uniref:Fis family transcriptional regulator n=1 Tax=Acuticoccus sediminis TaxID=2184697 RepID=A0A8B2P1K5_9HYPH|nr:GAF domain-containing protein [Acuticoccus sediminis]RAI03844.1 Fis family transcriptional regulator [Acuticoccus sediminis]
MKHADRVWAAVTASDHHAAYASSWRRCVTVHGLDPEVVRQPPRLTHVEFRRVVDRSAPLVNAARGELDRLFSTFGHCGCCLVLTDDNGLALERRGRPGDDDDFEALGLAAGSLWDEASVGTNGIGTALAETRPVSIFRDRHFLTMNTKLSCATAPIGDHRGRIVGALDISSARDDMSAAFLSVYLHAAREAAAQIETTLFRSAFAGARIILVAGSAPRHGLLAVDRDDVVIGASGAARRALGIDDGWITAGHLASDVLDGEEAPGDFAAAERRALRAALTRSSGNVSAAARHLGTSRATLHRKMKRLGLNRHGAEAVEPAA